MSQDFFKIVTEKAGVDTGFFQKCHRIFSKMTQDFFKNDTEKAGVDTGKRESTQDFFKNVTGFFQK